MPASKAKIVRLCIVCGKSFVAGNVKSLHCSKKCSDETSRNKKRALKKEEARQKIVTQSEGKQFLSVVEVYNKYNISKATLYRWIKQGRVKAYNPGTRMTVIDQSELESILEVRTVPFEEKPQKRLYALEPEDCYTIGEVSNFIMLANQLCIKIFVRMAFQSDNLGASYMCLSMTST